MTVTRDFEEIYTREADPWNIGAADSGRYNHYLELLTPHAGGAVLDIGCGFGAFLARFQGIATSLSGVELSQTAVAKGRERFPFLDLHQGSADALEAVSAIDGRRFDLIICSDVIYYLPLEKRRALLAWINRHLTPTGKAFVAAWCPGGRYPTPEELIDLTGVELVIASTEKLESDHVLILADRRRILASLTFDYETWHPIPEGKAIDWPKTVFEPTEKLFDLFRGEAVALTLFVEIGEYFWLKENEPEIAARMEEQLRDAVRLGHDVQLHLHPNWLPELGAERRDGAWHWNWDLAHAHNYPGDLTALIRRCKETLEQLLIPVDPAYRVTCFRAGAYQAQPFERLSEALAANGIVVDSSVFTDGVSAERGYDYRNAHSQAAPYFADRLDPQLRAVPAEDRIVEIPIFTPERGKRWLLDGDEATHLAERLLRFERDRRARSGVRPSRLVQAVRGIARKALYRDAGLRGRLPARLLPRQWIYRADGAAARPVSGHGYYVAIGHTKSDLQYEALAANVRQLREELGVEFVKFAEMGAVAEAELRARAATAPPQPVAPGPSRLLGRIPLDTERLLYFGQAGDPRRAEIAAALPWIEIALADAAGGAPVDCVFAENTLEQVRDIDLALRGIFAALRPGGTLLGAIRLDATNPAGASAGPAWQTTQAQALERLRIAGFGEIAAETVDTLGEPGMPPAPGSLDRMLVFRARRPAAAAGELARVQAAMDWLYRRVAPGSGSGTLQFAQIIADRETLCLGYTLALGELLQREGFPVTWITMIAADHPRGRGPHGEDAHAVLEVSIEGRLYTLDPMANRIFPHTLNALLAKPELTELGLEPDDRYKARDYAKYASAFWYQRVVRYARRRRPLGPALRWITNPYRHNVTA